MPASTLTRKCIASLPIEVGCQQQGMFPIADGLNWRVFQPKGQGFITSSPSSKLQMKVPQSGVGVTSRASRFNTGLANMPMTIGATVWSWPLEGVVFPVNLLADYA